MISPKPVIELIDVTKTFTSGGSVTAVAGVNLTIARGDLVSIVGPSGSGKSTLLNLIGALDHPTSGEVRINGVSLRSLTNDGLTRVRRDTVGFIFQFFNLLPSLTCLENVALPLHLLGWSGRKARERANELLELVNLQSRITHRPDELSGGERQRVAIARALSNNPPVLLADEPTGNLDSGSSADILGLIRDLNQQLGSTVLIVTHDRGVAENCSRMLTMRDGAVVKDFRR